MKFKTGDIVKILPFKLKGRRYEHYVEEMLGCVGKVGKIEGVYESKPKYGVNFDINGRRYFWLFFSSDLELVNVEVEKE